MNTRRPVIGICSGLRKAGEAFSVEIGTTYVDAVCQAGGAPLVLPSAEALDLVPLMLERVDGLLVPGGPDIDPARYGQDPHESRKPLEPRREAFDLKAAETARGMGLPVMGICLGCQILNVSRGGVLMQDVPTMVAEPLRHKKEAGAPQQFHDVEVLPGTVLASIVGAGQLEVNTSHHQAVVEPGKGLAVAARAPDGVVEAVEDPEPPLFLGIQWHPEAICDRPQHLALFQALVRAAAGR